MEERKWVPRRFRPPILKIHVYAGLLTFAQLAIYGVAGLAATWEERPRAKVVRSARDMPYTAPASKTDKEVADDVYRTLGLPLTRPLPLFAIRRNELNDLALDFYNVNGIHRVTVLECEHRLHIEDVHNGPGTFLNDLHTLTLNDREAPRLVRVWGYYNAAAMWPARFLRLRRLPVAVGAGALVVGMGVRPPPSGAYNWSGQCPRGAPRRVHQ